MHIQVATTTAMMLCHRFYATKRWKYRTNMATLMPD